MSSSPSVRSVLEGDRPDDDDDRKFGKKIVALAREYFGEEEETSWTDRYDDGGTTTTKKKFENEPDSNVRRRDVEIERTRRGTTKVRVAVLPPLPPATMAGGESCSSGSGMGFEGDGGEIVARGSGSFDASAAASAGGEGARALLSGAGLSDETTGRREGVRIALDFEEDDDDAAAAGAMRNEAFASQDFPPSGEADPSSSSAVEAAARRVKNRTPVYSSFHHFSSDAPPSANGGTSRSSSASSSRSDDEIRISALRYAIETLDRDLKDPNCVRDIDDMTKELREAKAELRRLTWGSRWRRVWGGGRQ